MSAHTRHIEAQSLLLQLERIGADDTCTERPLALRRFHHMPVPTDRRGVPCPGDRRLHLGIGTTVQGELFEHLLVDTGYPRCPIPIGVEPVAHFDMLPDRPTRCRTGGKSAHPG